MRQISVDDVVIRQARSEELPLLADIEIDAFATLAEALGVAREARSLPREVLVRSLGESLLFVAIDEIDNPVGFLAGTELDDTLYVIELDVMTRYQRKGLGRRLMLEAIKEAQVRKYAGITLTTDRYVAFNAPFYQSMGFELLDVEHVPQCLRRKLDEEIDNGMDPHRRVAMALWWKPSERT